VHLVFTVSSGQIYSPVFVCLCLLNSIYSVLWLVITQVMRPIGCEMLRIPHFLDHLLTGGSESASRTCDCVNW
jgi:hypothetical protein